MHWFYAFLSYFLFFLIVNNNIVIYMYGFGFYIYDVCCDAVVRCSQKDAGGVVKLSGMFFALLIEKYGLLIDLCYVVLCCTTQVSCE